MGKDKTVEFKDGKGNVQYLIEDNILLIKVDLTAEPVMSNNGNPMAAKGYLNFSHNDSRIFGNVNLNIGKNKATLRAENDAMAARIAELEAKLAE
jgi:hypothetical protein